MSSCSRWGDWIWRYVNHYTRFDNSLNGTEKGSTESWSSLAIAGVFGTAEWKGASTERRSLRSSGSSYVTHLFTIAGRFE